MNSLTIRLPSFVKWYLPSIEETRTEPVGLSNVSLIRPYLTYKYSIWIAAWILYKITLTWGNPSEVVSCSISTLSYFHDASALSIIVVPCKRQFKSNLVKILKKLEVMATLTID